MKSEQDLLAALRTLAESDREVRAPVEIEERVRHAFRRKNAWRKWKWAAAAAAAVAIATIAGLENRRTDRAVPVVYEAKAGQARVEQTPAAASLPAMSTVRSRPHRARARQPREIATEFFPLVEAAPPVDRGELVRVTVPASAMQMVGLPVREDRLSDRVAADVLVSEDGLATAIRFVKWQ